jgi:hypothetical protein
MRATHGEARWRWTRAAAGRTRPSPARRRRGDGDDWRAPPVSSSGAGERVMRAGGGDLGRLGRAKALGCCGC